MEIAPVLALPFLQLQFPTEGLSYFFSLLGGETGQSIKKKHVPVAIDTSLLLSRGPVAISTVIATLTVMR